MIRFFVIHYHELGLKKGNRDYFENVLCANINSVLEGCGAERAKRISGRVLLPLLPDADISEIKNRLPSWCVNPHASKIPLVMAHYGADAGIAGGAALCSEELS